MSSQQEYFVPGFGISRQVMFSHIQFYLGPYASVRPYSYQVRTIDLLCPSTPNSLPLCLPTLLSSDPSGICSLPPGPRRIPGHGTGSAIDQGTCPRPSPRNATIYPCGTDPTIRRTKLTENLPPTEPNRRPPEPLPPVRRTGGSAHEHERQLRQHEQQ